MARSKSFTDVEQSSKLTKILPIESADMKILPFTEREYRIVPINDIAVCDREDEIYAWSLAALLDLLPNNEHISTTLSRGGWNIEPPEYVDKWWCEYEDNDHTRDFSVSAGNPIDACVAIILKLHEQKLL